MASKIETPPKKTPPPIAVLARQIEALKNDSTPEKLKTVEPRISHLDERIKVLKNSREGHLGELTKINEEFEKIREELEIKNFFERFEASEKVAKFLKDNPKKKPAELAPEEFTTNPELQDPKIWENILEDARLSLNIQNELTNPKFEIGDPKTWKVKSAGATIEKLVKENPKIAAAAALGLGIAAIALLMSKSKMKKVLGGAAGFLGGVLGFKLWGASLGDTAEKAIGKVIGEGTVNDVKKYAKRAKKAGGDLIDKMKGAVSPSENKKPSQENLDQAPEKLDEFDQHTKKFSAEIGERSRENALIYEMLRAQLKSNDPTIDQKDIEHNCKILESGGILENKTNYYWNKLFNKVAVTIFEGGLHIASVGGYFVYKIAKEDVRFYQNLTKYFFNRSIENYAELTQHYALNAIFVGGVVTAWEYARLVSKAGRSSYFIPAAIKGARVGVTWPVYSVQIAGEATSKFATKMKSPKLLGRWRLTKNIFEFVDKSGKILAKFGPKGAISLLGKGGKFIKKGLKSEVLKKGGRKTAEIAKGAKKLSQKATEKIAKKLGLKTLSAPIRIIGGKLFWAWTMYEIGDYLYKLHRGDTYGKAGKILYDEIEKKRKLFQAVGSHGIHGLGDKKDFDFNPFVGSMREEGTLAEAIHATNKRIEKELPGTPLFEVPTDLEKAD